MSVDQRRHRARSMHSGSGQSRTVRLRIYERDSQFLIEVGDSRAISTGLTRDDVQKLNRSLKLQIETVARRFCQRVTLKRKDSRRALDELAFEGSNVLKRILGEDTANLLKSALSVDPPRTLHIVSEGFFVPWELLYDDFRAGPRTYKNFWGYKYIISRTIPLPPERSFLPPDIYVLPRANMGLLVNEALDQVRQSEIPTLERFRDAGHLVLIRLRPLERERHEEEVDQALRRFLDGGLDLVHFACHARASGDGEDADRSCFVLSRDFDVNLKEFRVHGLRMASDPLVILNACDTGIRDSLQTSGFVRTLLESGARGVIATECAVPDVFAAAFSKQFYKRLLKGRPVGSALLKMRRHFLKECKNPLGLLYSLYADPETRLIRI